MKSTMSTKQVLEIISLCFGVTNAHGGYEHSYDAYETVCDTVYETELTEKLYSLIAISLFV